jgi:hypothetical protein
MRTKGWVLLTATLLDGVGTGICFGQSDNVTTVMIEEVGGNVTADLCTRSEPIRIC